LKSDWHRYTRVWTLHSVFYSFSFTLSSTIYQAYAIRILKFDVNELGNAVFITLAAVALGNFFAVPLVQRFRSRRVLLWKIFTSINITSWALTGFSDLLYRDVFLLLLALAQLTGAIGGLAYSDTIADLIPKEMSIKIFSRVNVYTVTASLISLIISFAVFSRYGFVLVSYRICYIIAISSAILSSAFLWFMRDLVRRDDISLPITTIISRYRSIVIDGRCKHYITSLTMFTFFVNLPVALWNYYIIKIFGGNELWITVNTISSTFASAIGNYILSSLSHKLNPKKTVVYSTIPISFVPILFLISPTLETQALLNLYSGFSWAGFSLMISIYNLYLAGEDRVYLVAVLGILTNIGASAASRIGSAISTISLTAMQSIFIASGLGRLAMLLYMKRKVPEI
jgi:MFS family permease